MMYRIQLVVVGIEKRHRLGVLAWYTTSRVRLQTLLSPHQGIKNALANSSTTNDSRSTESPASEVEQTPGLG